MGAHPYWYFVDYQPNIESALEELREREFNAGRYNPVIPFLDFPITPNSPAPGAQHATIAEACLDADADGTRSILDIISIGETPFFFTAGPLQEDFLLQLYGTTQPTRQMLEEDMSFLGDLERGHCVYIVTYKDEAPSEILFAGYSFD